MHREALLKNLANYQALSSEEEEIILRFKQFVETTSACFERSHKPGHITGSAFVFSADRSCILMTHHAKLKKWLHLGGHADGCPNVHEVAHREAVEESGISNILPLLQPHLPIDFDIHEIPASKKEDSHFHYDVRYVFRAEHDNFICSDESLALKWVPLREISSYCNEPAILRAIKKLDTICV